MALLLVVAVISVLSAVVIRFNNTTQAAMTRSFRFQDDVVLQNMAESGIDIACSLLYSDGQANETDNLLEDWSQIRSTDLGTMFDDGSLLVSIDDLSGRFPINSLVGGSGEQEPGDSSIQFREVLVRLLQSGAFGLLDEIQARTIADSLTDWLDSDDEPLPYGAENSYYLTREQPYIARNGPVDFIDELLQVQGIDAALLYGNNEKRGLADYIRIYGGGRININTAPVLIFQVLAEPITEDEALLAEEYRTDSDSAAMLDKADWYRSLSGWPQNVVIDPGLITTKSAFFTIDATARNESKSMQVTADVGRDNNELIVYYRKWN